MQILGSQCPGLVTTQWVPLGPGQAVTSLRRAVAQVSLPAYSEPLCQEAGDTDFREQVWHHAILGSNLGCYLLS